MTRSGALDERRAGSSVPDAPAARVDNPTRRVPLNLFGIPFGLSGLATAWTYAGDRGLAPIAVRDVLSVIGVLVWLAVLGAYIRSTAALPRAVTGDLMDPGLGPFGSLAIITPLVLTVDGLLPCAPGAARTVVVVLAAAIVALGGWYTGQWIYGSLRFEALHPGYFLPTVAGGLLAAGSAGAAGYTRLGELLFGLGIVCWLVLGSIMLARLMVGPPLPDRLMPTVAIEIAPAAAATLAYLSLHGDHIDPVVAGIGGYGLLMVLAQVRLLPAYRRLAFVPGFWSFTFSWAATVTAAQHWLADQQPACWRAFSYLILAALSLLVGAIALRTLLAISRGQLLAAPQLEGSASGGHRPGESL